MIYVDKPFDADPMDYANRNPMAQQARRWGTKWCHMWADKPEDEEELHRIAKAIGLRRAYFQCRGDTTIAHHRRFPHYDLIPSKRALAIKAGAIEGDLREWLKENNPRLKALYSK
jgi:hypothetical protein